MLMCHGNYFSCSMEHLSQCGVEIFTHTMTWVRVYFHPAPKCWDLVGLDVHDTKWHGGSTYFDITRLCKTLDDLAAILFVKDSHKAVDMDNLPKFGGDEPSNCELLHSWDQSRVLGKRLYPRWRWEAEILGTDEEVVGYVRSLRGRGMGDDANKVISEFIKNKELAEALREP